MRVPPPTANPETPRSEGPMKGSRSAPVAARPLGPEAFEPERRDEEVDRERLNEAVRNANADVGTLNRSLKFRVHDDSGQLMVEIVDRGSGETIRTNPPEEFLDLAVRMREMVGFFFDETR